MRSNRLAWPCWRCHVEKPREQFPLGRSLKRRSGVCWACTETEALAIDEARARRRATWVEWRTWEPAAGWLATRGREVVVRRCFVCREVKDLDRDYYGTAKALPGSKYQRPSPCKRCSDARIRAHEQANLEKTRARRRMLAARYRARHPDRVQERNKRRWEKIKADPVLHAKTLEDARIARRLRKERTGDTSPDRPTRARYAQPTMRDRLPSMPLVRLIERIVDQRRAMARVIAVPHEGQTGVVGEVCADLGVSSRSLRAWRSGEVPTAQVGVVERVLLNAGVEWYEVYSYDDHAAHFLADIEVPS